MRGEGGSGAWRSRQGRLRGQACLGTATSLTRLADGTGRRRGLRSAEGRGTCQLDGFERQRARHVRARRAGERRSWPISTLGSRPVVGCQRLPTAQSRTLSVFRQRVPGARSLSGEVPCGGCGAVRGVAADGCNCLPYEQDTMSDRKAVVKNADMSGASLLFWRPLILGRLARLPLAWSLAPIARALSLPICVGHAGARSDDVLMRVLPEAVSAQQRAHTNERFSGCWRPETAPGLDAVGK